MNLFLLVMHPFLHLVRWTYIDSRLTAKSMELSSTFFQTILKKVITLIYLSIIFLGTQFARGFGGFGALLRWRIDTPGIENEEESTELLKSDQNVESNFDFEESDEYNEYEDLSGSLVSSGISRAHCSMNGNYMNDIEMMFGGSF